MADPNNILGDFDVSSISGDFDNLTTTIKKVSNAVAKLPGVNKKAMVAIISDLGKTNREINDITEAYEELGDKAHDLSDLIKMTRSVSRSSKEASAILRAMGLSGRYVYDELRKLESGMGKTTTATEKFSKSLSLLDGSATVATLGLGALWTSLKSIADTTAKYNKEIYDAARVSNVFGNTTKETRSGLEAMAKSVNLNERSAAKFYQTWMKVSNGMAPTSKQMVGFIEAIGDEFGNTEESINTVVGHIGKLQKMQIGIDMDFIENLRNGLVDTEQIVGKIADLRILDPEGAQESIEMLMRFKDSANVEKETKELKSMSDLMAYLSATIEKFVAHNGDKLKKLIDSIVNLTTLLINIADKIPGPFLQVGVSVAATNMFLTTMGLKLISIKGTAGLISKLMGGFGALGGVGSKIPTSGHRIAGDAAEYASNRGLKSIMSANGAGGVRSLGEGFKGLLRNTKAMTAAYLPLIAIIGAAVAAFALVTWGMNKYHDKEKGASTSAIAGRGYDEALEMQRKGNRIGSRGKAQSTYNYSKANKDESVSLGLGAGLMVGLAAGALAPPLLPFTAVIGTVVGGLVALDKASASLSESTQKRHTLALTDFQLSRMKNDLTEREIKSIQKKNAEDVKEIKEAKFGTGRVGRVKEYFSSSNMAKEYSGSSGSVDYEMQLMNRNVQIGEQMSGIQKEIEDKNNSIIDAYSSGQIDAAKKIEKERDDLNKKSHDKALKRKANELRAKDSDIIAIAKKSEAEAMAAAEKKAEELLGVEGSRSNNILEINRRMNASVELYKNQQSVAEKILQAHKDTFNVMQKMGHIPQAKENLKGMWEYTMKMSANASKLQSDLGDLSSAMINMEGGVEGKDASEAVAKKQNEIRGEIKSLESEENGEENNKERIAALDEEIKMLNTLETAKGRSEKLAKLTAFANSENAKYLLQIEDITKNIGMEHETDLALRKGEMDLGQAQLDLTKSLLGGIGLTFQMQMEQIGKVRNSMVEVDNIISEKQNHQIMLQNQRIALEKELAEAQMLGDAGKERVKSASIGLNEVHMSERTNAQELFKIQQDRVGLVQKEAELTKDLRYGYLGAIQSQALAAGQFQKIIFTRDQHTAHLLSMRTKEMMGADESIASASGYNEMLGGTYNDRDATNARRAGPVAGMHTTRGFMDNFQSANRGIANRGRQFVSNKTAENLYPGRQSNTYNPYSAAAMTNVNRETQTEAEYNNTVMRPVRENNSNARSDAFASRQNGVKMSGIGNSFQNNVNFNLNINNNTDKSDDEFINEILRKVKEELTSALKQRSRAKAGQ